MPAVGVVASDTRAADIPAVGAVSDSRAADNWVGAAVSADKRDQDPDRPGSEAADRPAAAEFRVPW